MFSQRLAILAVFAALPALAQVPAAPAALSGEQLFLSQNGPMRLNRAPSDGTVSSSNWSGYAVTGTDFTDAQGSWKVAAVNCTKSPNGYAAFWVGIDGYASTTVEQTGTLAYCVGTTAHYYAWYEFYPQVSVEITTVPVTPGNTISASVTYTGSEFKTTITNETTGKTFSKTGKVSGAKRSSAEWIAEAPCCTSSGGILPLADFGTGSFGDDYTDVIDTNAASDSTITGPVSDFGSKVEEITMATSSGVKESVPSALTTDGSSFKVTWKSK
jgi:hypothetical protein